MTAFLAKSFSVSEGRSEVPNEERQANWDAAFGNSCAACSRLGWAQTPMRNVKCPMAGCPESFCEEHRVEHMKKIHNYP